MVSDIKRYIPNSALSSLRLERHENSRSNVRTCAAGDGAICSKNRKIVPYQPTPILGARLRSPSPIMALATNLLFGKWPPCCATPSPAVVRTRPRAIPLLMTTLRKSVHVFHFPYMVMGLRLAALAAGAPL